jgi:hypothetical protein
MERVPFVTYYNMLTNLSPSLLHQLPQFFSFPFVVCVFHNHAWFFYFFIFFHFFDDKLIGGVIQESHRSDPMFDLSLSITPPPPPAAPAAVGAAVKSGVGAAKSSLKTISVSKTTILKSGGKKTIAPSTVCELVLLYLILILVGRFSRISKLVTHARITHVIHSYRVRKTFQTDGCRSRSGSCSQSNFRCSRASQAKAKRRQIGGRKGMCFSSYQHVYYF